MSLVNSLVEALKDVKYITGGEKSLQDERQSQAPVEGGRRTGESTNPYLSARRTWNDLMKAQVATRRSWEMIAILCLLITLASVCDIAFVGRGLRDDFGTACRAITASQASLTLALLALSPLTAMVYQSGLSHGNAVLFNAGMFTIATAAAQVVLFTRYRALIAQTRRHVVAIWFWLVVYGFVGVQMGWMLRPFIGTPGKPVAFFREEPFSNAFVVIVRLLGG